MHHPWRVFRGHDEWTLVWADLPDDLLGETDWDARTVTLDRSLLHADRRVTICHETAHIQRGELPEDPVLRAREHHQIDRAIAHLLIDVRDLGEALAWSEDPEEVADELQVNEHILRVRLAHLHPSEKHYLMRRLDDAG